VAFSSPRSTRKQASCSTSFDFTVLLSCVVAVCWHWVLHGLKRMGVKMRQDSSTVPFWFTWRVIFYASYKFCSFLRLWKTLKQLQNVEVEGRIFLYFSGKNWYVWSTLPCEKVMEYVKHWIWCNKIHCTEVLLVKEICVSCLYKIAGKILNPL
jgi:hypothetical protein